MTLKADEKGLVLSLEGRQLKLNHDEDGFTPLELLVNSIAGCSGLVFKNLLAKKRIAYDELTIETDHQRSDVDPKPVTQIDVHFTLKGENLDEKQVRSAFELVTANCPVVQSVKAAITINETLDIAEKVEEN